MAFSRASLHSIFLTIAVLILLSCTGCTGDSFDNSEQVDAGSLPVTTKSLQSSADGNGVATFDFDVAPGATSIQLVATGLNDGFIGFDTFSGPSGKLVDAQSFSQRFSANPFVTSPLVFNYPTLPSDVFTPGAYRLRVIATRAALEERAAGTSIRLDVSEKRDATPTSGTVNLHVVYAGPIADVDSVRDATVGAIEECGLAYQANGIDFAVDVAERRDLPALLPDPRQSAAFPVYREIVEHRAAPGITLVIGFQVDGISEGDTRLFALAASSPQPFEPGPKNAIVFSIDALGGEDDEFNRSNDDESGFGSNQQFFNDEQLHFANVICHEVGRALGLANSVEFGDSSSFFGGNQNEVTRSDLLGSTASCTSLESCENNEAAARNIMFPFTIIRPDDDDSRTFHSRDQMTSEQTVIMNRSPLLN